jgi:hypothetical protein
MLRIKLNMVKQLALVRRRVGALVTQTLVTLSTIYTGKTQINNHSNNIDV